MATIVTYRVEIRYFIYPEQVGKLADIPAEIKNKYLQNNNKCQSSIIRLFKTL